MKKGNRLTLYIIIALIAGIILGFVLNKRPDPAEVPGIAGKFSLLADVFLRLIKMIVAALVFFILVGGVIKLCDIKAHLSLPETSVSLASLVVIAGTLTTFNIPEAGLALLLGIDPLSGMGRSATNVVGNSVATAVVSKWENALKN